MPNIQKKKVLSVLILIAGFCTAFWLSTRQPSQEQTALTLSDEAARTAWLELRGWQVGEPTVSQMRMPDTYETPEGQSWLRLQAAQGLSPEDYAGCTAARYVYPVLSAENEYLYAELILCEDVLIGAQVYDASTRLMQSVL